MCVFLSLHTSAKKKRETCPARPPHSMQKAPSPWAHLAWPGGDQGGLATGHCGPSALPHEIRRGERHAACEEGRRPRGRGGGGVAGPRGGEGEGEGQKGTSSTEPKMSVRTDVVENRRRIHKIYMRQYFKCVYQVANDLYQIARSVESRG